MSSESVANDLEEVNNQPAPAPVKPNKRCKATPKNDAQKSEDVKQKGNKRRNTIAGEEIQAKKKQKPNNAAVDVHDEVAGREDDNCRGSFLFDGAAVVCERRVKMKRNLKLCTIVAGLSLQTLSHVSPTLNDSYTTFLGPKDDALDDIYIQIHFHQDTLIEQGDKLAIYGESE